MIYLLIRVVRMKLEPIPIHVQNHAILRCHGPDNRIPQFFLNSLSLQCTVLSTDQLILQMCASGGTVAAAECKTLSPPPNLGRARPCLAIQGLLNSLLNRRSQLASRALLGNPHGKQRKMFDSHQERQGQPRSSKNVERAERKRY